MFIHETWKELRSFSKKDWEIVTSDYEPAERLLQSKFFEEVLCAFPMGTPDKVIWEVFRSIKALYFDGVRVGKELKMREIKQALEIS